MKEPSSNPSSMSKANRSMLASGGERKFVDPLEDVLGVVAEGLFDLRARHIAHDAD
jgi:hypothetical protein